MEQVNAEKMEQTSKRLRIIGNILTIIGVLIIVAGIYMVFIAKNSKQDIVDDVNSMITNIKEDIDEDPKKMYDTIINTVNESSKLVVESGNKASGIVGRSFAGILMIMFGFFVSIIGLLIRFLIANRKITDNSTVNVN